jgi:adenosylcobinamide-phosphate synthase
VLGPATTSLAVDLLLGEPPTALHPTVAMGNWIAGGRRRRRASQPIGAVLEGAATIATGMFLTAVVATLGDAMIEHAPSARRGLVAGLALKPALSIRALVTAASRIERLLYARRLGDARRALSRDLVSRDTSRLSAAEVAGATIESVAENLSDSFVGPLLAFRLDGVRGAYMYRFINTADAMLGYRTAELEWFGKPAARLDDLANLLPSRLTALLIAVTAMIGGGSTRRAMRVAVCDARRTASPNAGWPMAAMAGALNVRLSKRGHYDLHSTARDPRARDIGHCCAIALGVSAIAALATDTL